MTIWNTFITMPTTAIGICAYGACPNTASAAPYLRSILLIAAIAATNETCERKLQIPSDSVRPMIFGFSRKHDRESAADFMRRRYHTAAAAVTSCPMTVATAAPVMPARKTKIKIGSSTRLTTAPASVEAIAKRGLPSARIIGFIACPNI